MEDHTAQFDNTSPSDNTSQLDYASQVNHTCQFNNTPILEPGTLWMIEIPVTDIVRAATFYRKVFGWSFVVPPFPLERKYAFFQKGDTMGFTMGRLVEVPRSEYHLSPINTGLAEMEQKQHLTPRFTLVVENIGETIAAIEKAGERVAEEGISGHRGQRGYQAWCLDTEDNMCGIWARSDKEEQKTS